MERLSTRLLDDSAKIAKIIGDCVMERELGDEFEYNGVELRVVEDSSTFSCVGCYFIGSEQNVCDFQNCLRCEREDNKSVKFVRIYE